MSRSWKPWFAWVHLFDAHHPYEPPEPYASRFDGRPYVGEVAYVDAQVGRLRAWLADHGQLENTWIVVVADHGERRSITIDVEKRGVPVVVVLAIIAVALAFLIAIVLAFTL